MQKVISRLYNMGVYEDDVDNVANSRTGKEFYNNLRDALEPFIDDNTLPFDFQGKPIIRSDIAASLLLNQAGIPGLRYFDSGSRDAKSGTCNFVIWNTDMIKLLGLTRDSDKKAKQYFREQNVKSLDSSESYKQIIGIDGARQLDKTESTHIRMDNLRIARRMERSGLSVAKIWAATGWTRGAEGKWRYEIPYGKISKINRGKLNELQKIWERLNVFDDLFSKNPNYVPTNDEQNEYDALETKAADFKLSDVFDAPELFAAYPDWHNVSVFFADLGTVSAQYDPIFDTITINRNIGSAKELRQTTIHEIQHAIQQREGFAAGSSSGKDTDIQRTPIGKFAKTLTNHWKKHVLYFPTRFWKYSIRNITGDFDALLAGDPTAVRFVPQAVQELYTAYYGDLSKVSDELKEFQARGGALTIESAQELQEYGKSRAFDGFINELNSKNKSALRNLPRSIGRIIEKLGDFREQILRYAAYLDYLHQMRNNPDGMPNNWGASDKDEVMSIDDIRDRAFKMANELLGAYDQVSETGKQLRDLFIPFYSWIEVNAKRYWQLLKNGLTEDVVGDFASKYLKGNFANVPYFTYKVGKTMLFISLLSILLDAFNHFFWPDDEEKLPPEIAGRPHITLGHDKGGNTLYFSQVGSLFDVLEWFGLDTFTHDIKQIFNGQLTVTDWIGYMLSAPFKKLVNSLPFYKTTFEIGSGMSFYPDFTEPRRTRDRMKSLAQSLGLSWPYKIVKGLISGEKYSNWEEFRNLFLYSQNAELAAYYYTKNLVGDFRKRVLGETFHNDSSSPKSDTLYRMKTALRFNDMAAAKEALDEYYHLGGTKQGADTSMRNTNPLHGLNKSNQEKFRAWLSHEDRKFLERAQAYYSKLMTNYKDLTANYTPPEGTQLPPAGNKRKSTRKKKQQTITPPKPIKRLKPLKTLKL